MFKLANQLLSKYFGIGVLIAIILAFFFRYTAYSFSPYSLALLFFLMFLSGFNLDWSKLKIVATNPKPIIFSNLLIFLVIPVVILVVSRLLLTDEAYIYGAVFSALTPTAAVAPFFANIFKTDKELSFVTLISSMILSPFVIPPLLALFVGGYLNIPSSLIFKDILILVPLPILLAALTKNILPFVFEFLKKFLPLLNFFILSFLIFIQFGSSFNRLPLNYVDTRNIVGLIIIGFIQDFFLILFLKPIVDHFQSKEVGISILISSSMKNIAIASTILLLYSPKAALAPAIGFIAHSFLFTPFILSWLTKKGLSQ